MTTEEKAVDEIENAPEEVAATMSENLSTVLVSLSSQQNIEEAAHYTSTQVEDASTQDLNKITSCDTKITVENVASETEEEQKESENENKVALIVSEEVVEVCTGADVLDNMEEGTKGEVSEETAAQHESSHLSEHLKSDGSETIKTKKVEKAQEAVQIEIPRRRSERHSKRNEEEVVQMEHQDSVRTLRTRTVVEKPTPKRKVVRKSQKVCEELDKFDSPSAEIVEESTEIEGKDQDEVIAMNKAIIQHVVAVQEELAGEDKTILEQEQIATREEPTLDESVIKESPTELSDKAEVSDDDIPPQEEHSDEAGLVAEGSAEEKADEKATGKGMQEHDQMEQEEAIEKTAEQAPVEDLTVMKEEVRTSEAEEAAEEVQPSTEMELEDNKVQAKEKSEGAAENAPVLGANVEAANVTSVADDMIQETDSVLVTITAASVTVTPEEIQEEIESSTVLAAAGEEVQVFSSKLHKATVVLVDLKSTCHPLHVKEAEQTAGSVVKETSHSVVEESEMLKEEEGAEGENIEGKLLTVYSEKASSDKEQEATAVVDEVKSISEAETTPVIETRTLRRGRKSNQQQEEGRPLHKSRGAGNKCMKEMDEGAEESTTAVEEDEEEVGLGSAKEKHQNDKEEAAIHKEESEMPKSSDMAEKMTDLVNVIAEESTREDTETESPESKEGDGVQTSGESIHEEESEVEKTAEERIEEEKEGTEGAKHGEEARLLTVEEEEGVSETTTEKEEDTKTAADEEPQREEGAPQLSDLQKVTVVLVDVKKNRHTIQEETTTVEVIVPTEEIAAETEDQQKELMEDETMVKENAPSFPAGKLDEQEMVLVDVDTINDSAEGKQSNSSDTCAGGEVETQAEENSEETSETTKVDEGKSVDEEEETTITETRALRRGKQAVTATPRHQLKRSKQNDEQEEEEAAAENSDEEEPAIKTRVLRRGRKSVTVIQRRKSTRSHKRCQDEEDGEEPTTPAKLDEEKHSDDIEEPVTEHRTLRTGIKADKATPARKSTRRKQQEEEEDVSATDVSEPSVQTKVPRRGRKSAPVTPKHKEEQQRPEVEHVTLEIASDKSADEDEAPAEKRVLRKGRRPASPRCQSKRVRHQAEDEESTEEAEQESEPRSPDEEEENTDNQRADQSEEGKQMEVEKEEQVEKLVEEVTEENTEEKSAVVAEAEKLEDTLTEEEAAVTVHEEEEDHVGAVKDIEEPVVEETSSADMQEANDTAKEEETLVIERSTTITRTEVGSDAAVSEEEEMADDTRVVEQDEVPVPVQQQSVLETLTNEQVEAPVAESSSEHLLTANVDEAKDIEEGEAPVVETKTQRSGGKMATTTPRRKSKRNQQQKDEEEDLTCVEKNTEVEPAVETRVLRKGRRSPPASARPRSKRVRKQLQAEKEEESTPAEGTDEEMGSPEDKTGNQEECPDLAVDEAEKIEDALTMEEAVLTVQEQEEAVKEVGSDIEAPVVAEISSAEVDEGSNTAEEEETLVVETSTTITTTEVGPDTAVSEEEGIADDTCVVEQEEVPVLTTRRLGSKTQTVQTAPEMQQQEEENVETEGTLAEAIHWTDDSSEKSEEPDVNHSNAEQTEVEVMSAENEAGAPAAEDTVKETDDKAVESTVSEAEREETERESPNEGMSETKEGESLEPPLIEGRTLRSRTRVVADTPSRKFKDKSSEEGDKEEDRECPTRRSQRIKPVVNYSENDHEEADELEAGIDNKEEEDTVELVVAEDKKNESSENAQTEISEENKNSIEEKAEDSMEAIETTGEEGGVQSLVLDTDEEAETTAITQDAQEEDQSMSEEEDTPVVIRERVLRGRLIPSVIITPLSKSLRSSSKGKKTEEVLGTLSLDSEKSPDSAQKRNLRKRKSAELTPVCKAKRQSKK